VCTAGETRCKSPGAYLSDDNYYQTIRLLGRLFENRELVLDEPDPIRLLDEMATLRRFQSALRMTNEQR
jgi:hypothetical protein